MIKGPEFAFVTSAQFLGGGKTATSASVVARSRTIGPVYVLNALGYYARAYSLSAEQADLEGLLRHAKRIVFGDLAAAGENEDDTREAATSYRMLLDRIEARSERVVFDMMAAPAKDTPALDFYADAWTNCLTLTAGSEYAARDLRAIAPRPVQYVAESLDGLAGTPWAARTRRRWMPLEWLAERAGLPLDTWRVRLLWSGEQSDVPSIVHAYPSLERLGREIPLTLRCICPQGPALEALVDQLHEGDPQALRLEFDGWSPSSIAQALASCDLVLLPAGAEGFGPRLASGAIASLHAGRFPVANPSPYYEGVGEFAWIGNDLAEGVQWALTHPEEVLFRVARGQQRVAKIHAPESIARAWLDVFHHKTVPVG